MLQKITKELFKNNNLVNAIKKNGFAAAAASDPIQKLFLDKIKEYSSKSNSAPNGLVDSNQQTIKSMEEELGKNFKKINDRCKLVINLFTSFLIYPIIDFNFFFSHLKQNV